MADTLLTRQHDGQTVAAAPGAQIRVQLDESPTTGYQWTAAGAADALVLIDSDFTPAPQSGLGGGGQRSLRFEVRRSGSHRLQLLLKRPWEGDDSAADRFTVTVQVV